MDYQSQAHIFLADQRGLAETDFFQSYHTFNFGQYVAPGREPFGKLQLLNDDTLRSGASLTMQVDGPTQVVLLPIMGGLDYVCESKAYFLEPGQAGILTLTSGSGMNYSISNPYQTEFINCLQLWFAIDSADVSATVSQTTFDLTTPNVLQSFFGNVPDQPENQPSPDGLIGRFSGRKDITYPISPVANGQTRRVFAFVVQGAFEVANRLLHEKDGLALTYQQANVLEFEALSNDAILILLTC